MLLRTSIIALLITIMLSGAGGYYLLVLKLMRWNAREQMERKLAQQVPNSQLTPIKFSIDGNTQSNKKELKYQGKMYDVVRVEISANTITYYCLSDIRETAICQQFDAMLEKETSKRKDDIGVLANDLFKLFSSILYSKTQHLFSCFDTATIFNKIASQVLFLSNGYQLKVYPPPQ